MFIIVSNALQVYTHTLYLTSYTVLYCLFLLVALGVAAGDATGAGARRRRAHISRRLNATPSGCYKQFTCSNCIWYTYYLMELVFILTPSNHSLHAPPFALF